MAAVVRVSTPYPNEREPHADHSGHWWEWNDQRAVWEHVHELCRMPNRKPCKVEAR